VAAQVGNLHHPDRPGFEDFGDVLWRGDKGTGYARVDWFTADGLGTWGDGRLTVLGTDGHIEVRSNVDIAGRGVGTTSSWSTGRRRATWTAPTSRSSTGGGSSTTSSTGPRPRCRRRTASSPTELVLTAQKLAQKLTIG